MIERMLSKRHVFPVGMLPPSTRPLTFGHIQGYLTYSERAPPSFIRPLMADSGSTLPMAVTITLNVMVQRNDLPFTTRTGPLRQRQIRLNEAIAGVQPQLSGGSCAFGEPHHLHFER